MGFEDTVIAVGIVVTSISLGYMLRLCQEIREIAARGADNK